MKIELEKKAVVITIPLKQIKSILGIVEQNANKQPETPANNPVPPASGTAENNPQPQ